MKVAATKIQEYRREEKKEMYRYGWAGIRNCRLNWWVFRYKVCELAGKPWDGRILFLVLESPWKNGLRSSTPANLSGCAFLLKIIVCWSVQIGFQHFPPDWAGPENISVYALECRHLLYLREHSLNPNPGRWGRIWLLKHWTGIT